MFTNPYCGHSKLHAKFNKHLLFLFIMSTHYITITIMTAHQQQEKYHQYHVLHGKVDVDTYYLCTRYNFAKKKQGAQMQKRKLERRSDTPIIVANNTIVSKKVSPASAYMEAKSSSPATSFCVVGWAHCFRNFT